MMKSFNNNRKLEIYAKLMDGYFIDKGNEAEIYDVSLKTIQRDLEAIRDFLERYSYKYRLVYDKKLNVYRLNNCITSISVPTTIAVIKILLGTKAFTKKELKTIIKEISPDGFGYWERGEKYYDWCSDLAEKDSNYIKKIVQNEVFNYKEPEHGKAILDTIGKIAKAIAEQTVLKILYKRMDGSLVIREINPVAILFSEYYFYVPAYFTNKEAPDDYINGTLVPVIYRIDRIEQLIVTDKHFKVDYLMRFQDGEFRKRIQFMQTGVLVKIKFYYSGPSLEAVLDRVPTAKILEHNQKGWLIEAEMFNKGIEMWLRSQGDMVEILEEKEIKNRTY